jgi:DUF4097 and DUF4098 domain-containing protein YvlB
MNTRMPAIALAALLMLSTAGLEAGHAAGKEVVFDESYSMKPGGKLEATVGDMDILLKVGKSNEALVEVTVTGDVDRMRERFEKMKFTAELDDNTLVIDTAEHRSWSVGWWGSGRGGIHLTVTLPKSFDIYAQTSDGDISAGGFDGEIELKSSDGDILIDRLTGTRVHLTTSDGDISVDDVTADDILMHTSDGDLSAQRLQGESIKMKTSDGDVDAAKIDGRSISIRSSDGDVDVNVSGGELEARTSDGDISVTVDGKIALDLSTSDGDIVIQVPKDFGAEIELKGERVKLGGKIALEGEVSKRHISGKLGEGGPTVRARTGDGSVSLRFD